MLFAIALSAVATLVLLIAAGWLTDELHERHAADWARRVAAANAEGVGAQK
ncbi:hypothetical protein SAMN05428985_105110 [Nocardioides sp. YR527]|uniref:hypothetical protein n=1 Tax=Nocardioides sp. YR527 TaxID=1881028 RepID=UPI00088F32B4|nr:hypothetical protein [Nocardioides sp. YR527]SDK65290.1 hypothetical protein SAMN05428985_105110 [Nocardioides sp. YR527]